MCYDGLVLLWRFCFAVMVLLVLQYEAGPDVPVHRYHHDRRSRYSRTSAS